MKATVPIDLLGPVPREVRLTRAGIALTGASAGVAIAALLVAIALTVTYRRGVVESDRREREAVPATAIVTSVMRNGGTDNDRFIVSYEYSVDGQRHMGAVRLRPRQARAYARGMRLPIEYMRSEPGISWTPGRTRNGMPVLIIPVIVFTMLGTAGGLLWFVVRQWRLLSEGRVAHARVVSATRTGKKGNVSRIAYEFETLSGAKRKSSVETSKPPGVGTVVPILYHREQPEWTALYPLQFVRPLRTPTARAQRTAR